MAEKSLEQKIQRALDFQEVANVMNKYELLLSAGQYDEVVELFAKRTPGVRTEMMWGVYEGTEGIKRLFGRGGVHEWMQGKTGDLKPGLMFSLPNANPFIEVAGDGKTAKGVWVCHGHEASPSVEDGKPHAYWLFARRACDFVKEDGVWKMWHYHVYGGYHTPYEKSFIEGIEHPEYPLPDELKPDKPPTTSWWYKVDVAFKYEPVLPEPYETFDEKDAY